jgi:hypothetical protein
MSSRHVTPPHLRLGKEVERLVRRARHWVADALAARARSPPRRASCTSAPGSVCSTMTPKIATMKVENRPRTKAIEPTAVPSLCCGMVFCIATDVTGATGPNEKPHRPSTICNSQKPSPALCHAIHKVAPMQTTSETSGMRL